MWCCWWAIRLNESSLDSKGSSSWGRVSYVGLGCWLRQASSWDKKKYKKAKTCLQFKSGQVITSSGFSFTVVINNGCVSIKPFQWALKKKKALEIKKNARWPEVVLLSWSQIILKNLQKKLWRSKQSADVSDGPFSVSPDVSTTSREIVATWIMTTCPVDRNPWKIFSILLLLLFTCALSCSRITASCDITFPDATDLTPNNLTRGFGTPLFFCFTIFNFVSIFAKSTNDALLNLMFFVCRIFSLNFICLLLQVRLDD